MPNGKMTTAKYVIEIHANLENLINNFEEHKKNHRWLWIVMLTVPAAVYYIIKLLGG